MSAGSIIVATNTDATGLDCTVSMAYDNQSKSTNITGTNNQPVPVQCRIAGVDPVSGAEIPAQTYVLTIPANGSQQIATNGTNGAIQLAVNSKGHLAGFNSQIGGTIN